MSQDVKNGETCKVPRLRCRLKNRGSAAVSAHSPFPQRPRGSSMSRRRGGPGRGGAAGPLPSPRRRSRRAGAGSGPAAPRGGAPATAPSASPVYRCLRMSCNGSHRRWHRRDEQAAGAASPSSADAWLFGINTLSQICWRARHSCFALPMPRQKRLSLLASVCLPVKWVCSLEGPASVQGGSALYSDIFASLQSISLLGWGGFNANGNGRTGKAKTSSALFYTRSTL